MITTSEKRAILKAIISGTIDGGLVKLIRKQIGEQQQAAIEKMTPSERLFGWCLATKREDRKLLDDDQAFYDQVIKRWRKEN